MSHDLYPPHLVEIYDYWYPDLLGDIPRLCELVAERAPGPRVLEYGVGTGRIALPLAEHGLEVTGVDNSEAMLARLAEVDLEGRVTAVRADFVREKIAGTYDAVLLMVNTLFVAQTLDEQVAVFANAAAGLADDGFLLVETFNPQQYHSLTTPHLTMRPLTADITLFEQFVVEPTKQYMITTNRVVGPAHNFFYTHVLRYMFPNEMDAVARIAGLHLQERWSDYSGSPYTAGSPRAFSIYGRAA